MGSSESLVSVIDSTWFGAGLPPRSLARLADLAREHEAPTGSRLLREGDETRELSVVLHGRVVLRERVAGRGEITLLTVEPGDIFGWSALTPPFRATSSVYAAEPVSVISFDAARLRAAVRVDTELAATVYQQVLEAVARRLLTTRQQLLDLYRADAVEPW